MQNSSFGKKTIIIGISIWFVCALLYAFEFFVRASTNALSSYFDQTLGLGSVTISLIGSIFYLFYVIAQLPAGMLVDRFGVKVVMILATALCLVGIVLFTFSTHSTGLFIGRAFVGFGGGFAFISSLKVISSWLPHRFFPAFAGLTQLMGYFGGVASGVPLVMLLDNYGELNVFIGVSIFCAVLLALSVIWVRSNPNQEHDYPLHSSSKLKVSQTIAYLFTNKQLLLNGFYCLFLTGTTAVFADLWGINYLTVVSDISRSQAASCVSMIYLGVALSSPFWGLIATLTNGSKIWLVTAGVVGFFVTIILLYTSISFTVAMVLCFLFGAVQSVHVLNFHMVHQNVKREQLGACTAFVNLFIPLSGFLFQPLSGGIINFFELGSEPDALALEKGLLVVPIFMLIALIISFFFKEASKNT